MSIKTFEPPRSRSPWLTTARFSVLFIGVLFGFDIAIDTVVQRQNLVSDIVDIQTPATLYAKLDYLRDFDGIKIVIIGDSVVYGRALLEDGDAEWREHSLSAQLQDRLKSAALGRPVLVMNLGMNGALPEDLESLLKIVVPIGVDKIVFDITLRSFSADFASAEARMSRPWLNSIMIDNNGYFHQNPAYFKKGKMLERQISNFLINHWALYRLRDFIQWRFLDGEPATAIREWRAKLDRKLRDGDRSTENPMLAASLLKLKAKKRHSSVNFDAENPQVAAFKRMLSFLVDANQSALVFYATEDATQMEDILEPSKYSRLIDNLGVVIAQWGKGEIRSILHIANLLPEHYIDYVHLNRSGYSVLAESLMEELMVDLN